MSKIIDMFNKICIQEGEKIAFIYYEKGELKTKTFNDLKNDTDIMANYLINLGVKKKDKILTFANASYELCVCMLASFKIGVSIMYVDILAKQDRLENAFNTYKPDYVFVSNKTKFIKVFFKEINKIKKVINIDMINYDKQLKATIQEEVNNNEIALLTMTTGSTGKPKTAIRTHQNLYEQLKLVNDNIDSITSDETVLTTSYIYVFANIMNGYTTVLPQINLALGNKHLLNKKLSKFKDIPITMIITSPDFCLKTDNIYHNLKKMYFGGAILNINEAKIILDKYPNIDIEYIYGATECNLISKINLKEYVNYLEKENKSILGQAVKGVEIKIDSNNEISVCSKALLENYLITDTTNKVIDEDKKVWHKTGDTGYYENGILYYYGRSKNFIKIGKNKIYSNQVEQSIINNFNEIDKCAILQKNNNLYLFIETKKVINYDKLLTFLKENYKISKIKITKIRKIPCDIKHHTKINYNKLLEKVG